MKIDELRKKITSSCRSQNRMVRMKSKGYMELLSLFQQSEIHERSEEVKLSLIAEEYMKKHLSLYNSTKLPEDKFKYQAAKECIIKYTSMDEVTILLKGMNTDRRDLKSFIEYMEGIGKMKYTKMADIRSAWELANL